MGKKDKAPKGKGIRLVRNILLVVLAGLTAGIGFHGYRTFSGQWEWGVETILFIGLSAGFVVDLAAVCVLTLCAGRLPKEGHMGETLSWEAAQDQVTQQFPKERGSLEPAGREAVKAGPARFGRVHHIGSRQEQQDSFGKAELSGGQGVLAVVADGMGGLEGGGQISQHTVMGMLNCAAGLGQGCMDGVLQQMVREVNDNINRLLGPEGMYKSGSTLAAVLIWENRFHWIAVGDSRIYLYREGCLLQVNQEHTLLQEWMPDILNGRMSYGDAVQNPEGRKLTSFIGMGQLKHVDCSLRSVKIAPGDRILLMSDGVFGTLSEEAMEDILGRYTDVQQAASQLEQAVLEARVPAQDNFTAVILGF